MLCHFLKSHILRIIGRQPHFPDVKWAPLEDQEVVERGLFADPEKKSLLAAASKVQHYTPAIGTELFGIDLRQLSSQQKDELCVFLMLCHHRVQFNRLVVHYWWQRGV